MPWSVLISRLCDEFSCTPSVAMREWLTAPCGFLEEILEARAYMAAKTAVDEADRAGSNAARPEGPMVDLVQQMEVHLHQQRMETEQT